MLLQAVRRLPAAIDPDIAYFAIGPLAAWFGHVIILSLFFIVLPNDEHISASIQSLKSEQEGASYRRNTNQLFFARMFITAVGLLNLIGAGIEAATAAVLEVDYAFDLATIGYIIGLCMFSFLPAQTFMKRLAPYVGEQVQMLSLLVASMCFSILLQPRACSILSPYFPKTQTCAAFVICSDAVVLPLVRLGYAVAQGLALQLAPDHSDTVAFGIVLGYSCGYGFGPALARFLWARGGISLYGFGQLIGLGLTFVLVSVGTSHGRESKSHPCQSQNSDSDAVS